MLYQACGERSSDQGNRSEGVELRSRSSEGEQGEYGAARRDVDGGRESSRRRGWEWYLTTMTWVGRYMKENKLQLVSQKARKRIVRDQQTAPRSRER